MTQNESQSANFLILTLNGEKISKPHFVKHLPSFFKLYKTELIFLLNFI